RGIGQLLDLTAINRLDNRIAGREVAVKRADPDASATRDLVEARLRPDFRERRLGRFEQAVAGPRRDRPGTSALNFFVSPCQAEGPSVYRPEASSVYSCFWPWATLRPEATRPLAFCIGRRSWRNRLTRH